MSEADEYGYPDAAVAADSAGAGPRIGGPEREVLPLCEELGIGFVPWSPLGVQFLTGWIDANTRFAQGDIRAVEGRFAPENLPHNLQLVALVKSWAERKWVDVPAI